MSRDDTTIGEGEYQELFGDTGPDASEVWVTKDRRMLLVCEMETEHLFSTIKFLRRNLIHYKIAELRQMGAYIALAPDGAADACSHEALQIMDLEGDEYLQHRFKSFSAMLREARIRGVKL